MATDERFRKYLEAGAALSQVTRARAEEIVHELVNAGDVQRDQAQQWVDDLLERSRKATEEVVRLVRDEVVNQLKALGIDPEDLGRYLTDTLRHSADVGRTATTSAASRAKRAARDVSGRGGRPQKAKRSGRKATAKRTAKKTTNRPAKKSTGAKKTTAGKKAAKRPTRSSAKSTKRRSS